MNKIVVTTTVYDAAGKVTERGEHSFNFADLPPIGSVQFANLPPLVVLGNGDFTTEIPAKPAEPTIKLVEKFPDGIVLEKHEGVLCGGWRVRRGGRCMSSAVSGQWWSYYADYDKTNGGFWYGEAEARERIAAYFAANNTPAIEQDVAGEFGCTRGKWRARIGVEFVHPGEQPFLSDSCFGGYWYGTRDEAQHALNAYLTREEAKKAKPGEPVIEYDEKKEHVYPTLYPCWRVRSGEFVFDNTNRAWYRINKLHRKAGFWRDSLEDARKCAAIAKTVPLPNDWRRTECVVDERNGNFRVRHVPTGMIWGSWVGWQDPADHSDKHPSASGYFYSRRSEFDSFYTRNDIKPPTTKAKAKKSEISFAKSDGTNVNTDVSEIVCVSKAGGDTCVYTNVACTRTPESFASVIQRIAEALKPR